MSNFNVCDPKALLLPQSRSEIFTLHVCSLPKKCPKRCLSKHAGFGTLLVIVNCSSTVLVSTNNRKIDVLSDPSGYLRYFTTESEQWKERQLWARPAGLRCLQQQWMFVHAGKVEMSQSFLSQSFVDYSLDHCKKYLTVTPSVLIITQHDIR